MDKNESSTTRQPKQTKPHAPLFGKRLSSVVLATQSNGGSSSQRLASAIEHHGSGRKSLSESTFMDPGPASGNVSLRKQFSKEEEHIRSLKMAKSFEDENLLFQVSAVSL